MNTQYRYNATVDKIVDGDTIDATVDTGFRIFYKVRIRIKNVDTPELIGSSPKEKEAALVAKAFLVSRLPIGSKIVMDTFKAAVYNRWEAYIYSLNTTTAVWENITDLIKANHLEKIGDYT